MGTVYRAYDPQLERDVALKLLRTESAPPAELSWERTIDLRAESTTNDALLGEARAMARLNHPNVLAVFEAGIHEDSVFLVAELVEGMDLRAWLATNPSPAHIRDALAQAGIGLAAAHARDVIHGDFKPDNVLVGIDGRVRVADFGLSRLVQRATGLVRDDSGAGTPAYMAPELVNASARTTRSDVYAYAATVVEALGHVRAAMAHTSLDDADVKARIEPALREVLRAALSSDPQDRPPVAAIVERLGPRRRTRLRWFVAAGVAACASAVAVVTLTRAPAVIACEEPPSPWTIARRIAVMRAVKGDPHEVLDLVDQKQHEIATLRAQSCLARDRGEITPATHAIRASCLRRRELELATATDSVSEVRPRARVGGDWVFWISSVPACVEIVAPPMTISDDAYATLEHRVALAGRETSSTAKLAALAAVEADAIAAGELELAARLALRRAQRFEEEDRHTETLATAQLAHQRATEIEANDLAMYALLVRVASLVDTGDTKSAESVLGVAKDLATKPGVHPWTKVRYLYAAANNAFHAARYTEALELATRARSESAASGRLRVNAELGLRQVQIRSLGLLGKHRDALALAEKTGAYALATIGESNENYGVILEDIATRQEALGQYDKALATMRRVAEVFAKTKGPTNAYVLRTRANLASAMIRAGSFQPARDEIREVLAASATNEGLRKDRGYMLEVEGRAAFSLGDTKEARRLFDEAIVEEISVRGKLHPDVGARLEIAFTAALEVGDVAAARDLLDRIRDVIAGNPDTAKRSAILLEPRLSALALAEGDTKEAERIARAGLAAMREGPERSDLRLAAANDVLSRSLVRQKRWSEALAAADEAIAISRRLELPPDTLAARQIPWIEAAAKLGRRGEARQLALEVRDTLARYPGRIRARAKIAAILKQLE